MRVNSTWSCAVTSARQPGATRIEVCGSTTTAGPVTRSPGRSASRVTKRASRQPPSKKTGAVSAVSCSASGRSRSGASGSTRSAASPIASTEAESMTSAAPGSKPKRARWAAAKPACIPARSPKGTASAASVPRTFSRRLWTSRIARSGTPCASTSDSVSTPSRSSKAAACRRLAASRSASTASTRLARISASPMP